MPPRTLPYREVKRSEEVLSTKPLSDVVIEFISGGTPSTKDPSLWDGNIPWTTSATIDVGDIYLSRAQRNISTKALVNSATNLVPCGSLLVGTRVGVGKAVVNDLDIAISQDLTGIRLDPTKADSAFVAYQFKTTRIQDHLAARARGTTIKGISRFDLSSVRLWLPSLGTQLAIVTTLDSIKECIRLRRRELALESERKAALMHHLFTHGTRGEPTKQTEIGEMPQSWCVTRIGDVADLLSGGTPSKDRTDWWQGSIPWVSPKDLKRPRLSDVLDHISEEAADLGSRVAPSGTVFIVVRGMILAKDTPVAMAEVPMAFNQDLKGIVPKPAITGEFLLNALTHRRQSLTQIIGTSAHGTRRIGTGDIEDFLVPQPSLEEQRHIGDILLRCDQKIESLAREDTNLVTLFDAMLDDLMSSRLRAAQ